MSKYILLLAGILLTGCGGFMTTGTLAPFVPPTLISLPTITPTVIPPTSTSSPTSTFTPSEIPPRTLTSITTITPTSIVHVFPIQPPGVAGFAEGTASHGYPATDIFAPVGAKFVAVTDGVVDYVSTSDLWDLNQDDPALRGGLSVAIIGKDGVRYYGSHLSAIAAGIIPGVQVKAGQELGLVGNSGDARTTLSHLHFGISRPSYPEDWKARRGEVDPYPFLLAWRDGHNITPPLPDLPSDTPTVTPN